MKKITQKLPKPQNGKYYTPREIEGDKRLQVLARHHVISTMDSDTHFRRWNRCLVMMMRELRGLKEKRVERVLDKYQATIGSEEVLYLLFPKGFNEKALPKELRSRKKIR